MKINIILFISVTVALVHCGFAQTVKRGRNEGTMFIPASNVMGNGNITAYVDIGGFLSPEKFEANALVGASIGLAQILQFTAQTSFINFNRFGPTEAHLQATLPGNDKLRFFGIALSGDLFLSTSLDTITEGADETKPEYNPYPLFSGIVDFDWLTRPKQLPLKTYITFNLADNAQLLFKYKQISLKTGIEWKFYQHSLFVDAGLALYKDKHGNPLVKQGYDQKYAWISPGGRYRIRNRFSFLANFQITVYRDFEENGTFMPDIFSVKLKFEAPLFYRETDTEAIRTLVFMEKKKEVKQEDKFSENIEGEESVVNKFEKTMSDLAQEDETFDYTKEKDDLIKRREEVESLMEKIEQLLREDKE
jgi:hypothetical protein